MDDALDTRQVLDRLIAERRDNYADLSRLLGRNPAYIQQFIKRGTPRKLDEADRRTLARYYGISEEALGGPAVPSTSSARLKAKASTVSVPRLTLSASAGAGSLHDDECVQGVMAFDAAWLRHLGVQPQHASIVRVQGESMAPTLSDGDEIIVDHGDGASKLRDGVYVLRLDGVLMVKRLVLGPRRGRFSILSDNPHYPNWTDIDPELIVVIGRVRWVASPMT